MTLDERVSLHWNLSLCISESKLSARLAKHVLLPKLLAREVGLPELAARLVGEVRLVHTRLVGEIGLIHTRLVWEIRLVHTGLVVEVIDARISTCRRERGEIVARSTACSTSSTG